MTTPSPQQIAGGFNRRESKAVDRVYRKYYPWVRGIVEERTSYSPETADLVEDIFLKLLGHPGHFKGLRAIRDFLYRVTDNACQNHLRHQRRVSAGADAIEPLYPTLYDNSIEEAENLAAIRSVTYCVIRQLPVQSQEIILLSYMEDLSNAEIAARMGIAEKTVANVKTMALKKLRAEMPEIKRRFASTLYFLP